MLCLLIFLMGRLPANPIDFHYEGDLRIEEKPLFISLGAFCEVAITLRNNELREAAFPFDWLDCRYHDGLIKLLNDDFAFFTDAAYFVQLLDCPAPHTVFNHYYGLRFHHDWPFPDDEWGLMRYEQQLDHIRMKYDRRIDRFRQLRSYPGKVFFIRASFWNPGEDAGSNPLQARELKEALDRYFPSLDFTLVIVNYTDANAPDIDVMKEICEFKINRSSYLEEFSRVYNQLLTVK